MTADAARPATRKTWLVGLYTVGMTLSVLVLAAGLTRASGVFIPLGHASFFGLTDVWDGWLALLIGLGLLTASLFVRRAAKGRAPEGEAPISHWEILSPGAHVTVLVLGCIVLLIELFQRPWEPDYWTQRATARDKTALIAVVLGVPWLAVGLQKRFPGRQR